VRIVTKDESGALPERPGVWSTYRVAVGERFARATVIVRSAKEKPTQGICLRLAGGLLEVAGESNDGMVFWMDTAPAVIEVGITGAPDAILEVWNCWRGRHGERHAWMGNAGLLAEGRNGRDYLFKCSGPGEPDYTALVFEIELRWTDA
jgi:hypothetical protein